MLHASQLDCAIVGYNDMTLDFYEKSCRSRGEKSPQYRMFLQNLLDINGTFLPYMDVLNLARQNSGAPLQSQDGADYYHICEVSNLASVYLQSFLICRGYSARFVSLFQQEKEALIELLDRNPLAVAITTTFYVFPTPVQQIIDFIRRHNATTKIVVGGPLVMNILKEMDEEAATFALQSMAADIYVKESQGELTLARILSCLKSGGDLSQVPNIFIRNSNTLTFTREEPENNSLDEAIIDWDLFTDEELGETVQTRTARSCAFKCSFCDYPLRAGRLSLAAIDAVKEEIGKLRSRDSVRNVVFIDDTFNVPEKRFKELLKMKIQEGYDYEWYSYFRCSNSQDEEVYALMKESGCAGVFLGIESGDSGVLTNMNKMATVEKYLHGVQLLNEYDIPTFASFIIGFPGECEQSVKNTIDFLEEARPTFFRCEPWFYNHLSPIHARRAELGLEGQNYQWSHKTMDVEQACDYVEIICLSVKGSIWMPMYNFDFWALPYLRGKGMSTQQVKTFLKLGYDVMRSSVFARDEDTTVTRQRVDELLGFLQSLDLKAPRYRNTMVSRAVP